MKRIRYFVLLVGLILLVTLASCKGNAVKEAEQAIGRIGRVTLDSRDDIANAEKYYGILTESEKSKVENRIILANAKEEYQRLIELNNKCPFRLTWGASLDDLSPMVTGIDIDYAYDGTAVVDVNAKYKSSFYKEYLTLFFSDGTTGLNYILAFCDFIVKSNDDTISESELLDMNYTLKKYLEYMDEEYGRHYYERESQTSNKQWDKNAYTFFWRTNYYEIELHTGFDGDRPYVKFRLTDDGEMHFCQ